MNSEYTQTVTVFLMVLLPLFGFLWLGGLRPRFPRISRRKRRDAYEAGRVITVMDEKGRKHKAVLLPEEKPEEKPKETPSKKVSWRYKQP